MKYESIKENWIGRSVAHDHNMIKIKMMHKRLKESVGK